MPQEAGLDGPIPPYVDPGSCRVRGSHLDPLPRIGAGASFLLERQRKLGLVSTVYTMGVHTLAYLDVLQESRGMLGDQ